MAKKPGLFDVVKGLTQKKGTKDKEIEKYEKFLEEHPDDRNAINTLGDLYSKRGEADKACEYYLRVGALYAKDGFTLKAIAVYKKAQRAKPDVIQTYLDLADLYVQKGLISEAKANYLTVAEMQATSGAKHESLDTYRKIVDLDPENIKIRSKLAAMYENENFLEDAATIYIDIGDILIRKDVQNGKQFYEQALAIQSENENILVRVAQSYAELQMRQEAAGMYEKLLEISPDNPDYRNQLDLLTEQPIQSFAPEMSSPILFSEDDLGSLNLGEEPMESHADGGSFSFEGNHVIDFSLGEDMSLSGQAAFETHSPAIIESDHTLDFQIEDHGAFTLGDDDSDTLADVPVAPVVAQQPPAGGMFFDLAARLETAAPSKTPSSVIQPKISAKKTPPAQMPPSLPRVKIPGTDQLASGDIRDIVKEFKQGVLEEVGTEDFETHYELGISYKEMGLLDDAIEELKLAALASAKFVECQSVIALCYLEKEDYQQAIRVYREARDRVEPRKEQYQDLTYQIGLAYEQSDEIAEAAQTFQELFQINSNYRDVKRRLNKLLA